MAGSDPRWIGDYFIDGELGRGAMGVVYRVRHRDGRGPFALKLLKSETLEDSRALKRFAAEVGSQTVLGNCPGIVGVVDSGFAARGPFYVMPFVAGTNLRELLRNQLDPVPEETALKHVGAVVRALAYAHERGFVHRDVKPENVMVTPEGKVFLTDFGIVRVLGGRDNLTRTGELLGTPIFMAPEQVGLDFGKPGPHTDVYAIGVILYQIICKRSPYEALTSVALMGAILQGEPYPSPAALRPGLNPIWERIIEGCLAREPRDRYPNAGALWKDLSYALDLPVATASARGKKRLFSAAALVVLGLAAFGLQRGLGAGDPGPTPSSTELVALPSPTPSASPSASPLSLEERLSRAWISGEEEAFDALVRDLKPRSADEQKSLERYRVRVERRRAWRERWTSTLADGRKTLRAEFAELAEREPDPELRLLAQGFEALIAVSQAEGGLSALAQFQRGDLPALPELMRFVALVRPPAAALERWPASVHPGERARVAAWVGDLKRCRASLALLSRERRAALSWSLFAFVSPEELEIPELVRDADPGADADPDAALRAGYLRLAAAEEALAKGDPYSAALIFDELIRGRLSDPEFRATVGFGLLRTYVALGRPASAAVTYATDAKVLDGADLPRRAEIVGFAQLLASSLTADTAELGLRKQLEELIAPRAGFAIQSPWRQRLVAGGRQEGAAKTRLERQGGTLAEQVALSEAGADGALGFGLARLYRLAKAARDGAGIDYARDLYPRLGRYRGSESVSLLLDATRARLDVVTCRIAPPPSALLALAERDEDAAELVFQLRMAAYERDWFRLAEQRLLARKPLVKGEEIETLEQRLSEIKRSGAGTAEHFPESETFLLFRARLLVEEARLAWLYSDAAPVFEDLDRRVHKALGPLLNFELASDLESALGTLDNPLIDLEKLLGKLGRARARVTPAIAQAWTIRAMAGGPTAVLFHRARRVVDFDAPVVAVGRSGEIESQLRATGTASIPRVEFGGETLGTYSLRAARACSVRDFKATWLELIVAIQRQPDLLPWAVSVVRDRAAELEDVVSNSDPDSKFRSTWDAVSWLPLGTMTREAGVKALNTLGRLEPGPLRSLARLWVLSSIGQRGGLVDFLVREAAFGVHSYDSLCVASRSLLQGYGVQFDAVELDRALATGFVSSEPHKFIPGLHSRLAVAYQQNLWGDPALRSIRRGVLALERGKVCEGQIVHAEGKTKPWTPDPRCLTGTEAEWASSDWSEPLGALALRARGRLVLGRPGGVEAAVRHLFLTRSRCLSGASDPALLRVLPLPVAPSERSYKILTTEHGYSRAAARLFDAGESWGLLALGGFLSSGQSFSAFPEALGRTYGSELDGSMPRLGDQPTRDLMRWIAIETADGQRLTDAILSVLFSPSLRERVELKSLAFWLGWLAERSWTPGLGARLASLALWAACRMQPDNRLSVSEIATLQERYAQLSQARRALSAGAIPLYRFQAAWPRLLAGVVLKSGFTPAETTAAKALSELEQLPSWLESEPLLPRVLAAFPEFRDAYQAKKQRPQGE